MICVAGAVGAGKTTLAAKLGEALGARVLEDEQAVAITEKWMTLEAQGGRHARRVDKIRRIEERLGKGPCS